MLMTVPLFQTQTHHATCSCDAGVRGTHRGVAIIASAGPLRLRPQTPRLPSPPPTDYLFLLRKQCSIKFGVSVLLRMRLSPYIMDRPRFKYHYGLFETHPSLSRCPYYDVSEGMVRYTDGSTEGVHARLPVTIGLGRTGFPTMINCILMHAQQYEYDESAVC